MENNDFCAFILIFLVIGSIFAGIAFGPAAGCAAFFLFGAVAE